MTVLQYTAMYADLLLSSECACDYG